MDQSEGECTFEMENAGGRQLGQKRRKREKCKRRECMCGSDASSIFALCCCGR